MVCNICQSKAIWCENKIIYGRNMGKSYMIWFCPNCKAYVGCHNNTKKPLGLLTDRETKKLRIKCHELFDELWGRLGVCRFRNRRAAYVWLRDRLGVVDKQAHIGMFDKQMCLRFIEILEQEKNK